MEKRIICSGFGGQGVLVLGKILAQAGLMQKKQVSWLPSYGAEMRGGTAHCMVVISDEGIASPYVEFSDDAILMNVPSVNRFIARVKRKGLVVINKGTIGDLCIRGDLKVINRDFTKQATELGNKQVANIIALGVYISNAAFLKSSFFEKAIEEIFNPKGQTIVELNKKAFKVGTELNG